MLPIMKRIESDQEFPNDPIHGADGPLYLRRGFSLESEFTPPVRAFIDRALAMGLPPCPDLNVPEPLGVAPSPYNIRDGRRQSTAVAYLSLARGRANLHIAAGAAVTRLAISGGRVDGVHYRQDGQDRIARGARVVLSAGALHSPQILMLSGIGPAGALRRLDLPVVLDRPGVGENFQDHAGIAMTFEGRGDYQADWVVPRFRLIAKSDPARPCGNLHINMRPPTDVTGIKRMMPVTAHLLEQSNRGRLWLATADPFALPEIDSQMLEHPDDLRAMTDAMQFMYDLVQHPSLSEYYGPLLQPGPGVDWGVFARSTFESYQHPVGTCMMGPATNPMAVVDQRLRVHGMENLWVADASVMPTISHANTNITSIMIGERVSDIVKGK
jgi:choline dehydrogenase